MLQGSCLAPSHLLTGCARKINKQKGAVGESPPRLLAFDHQGIKGKGFQLKTGIT